MFSVVENVTVTESHTRPFEFTSLSRACTNCEGYSNIPLQLCLYRVPFLRYSMSNNGVLEI